MSMRGNPEIYDNGLAFEMAQKEDPYRTVAAIAIGNGQPAFAASAIAHGLAAAENCRIEYSRNEAYIRSFQSPAEDIVDETDPEIQASDEVLQSVIIHKSDLVDYFSEQFTDTERGKGIAGRLWQRLVYNDQVIFMVNTAVASPNHPYEIRRLGSTRLSELVHLLQMYDEQKSKNPGTSDAVILGRMWGPAMVRHLRNFVDHSTNRIDFQE